ncbi:MAG: ATP-dependent zinc metalloprotease FtsH [Planctomycetes bacterium]|nr:ATP-dependent zinc metalloprotease FtsH [Planctomycetota bacterium]
MVIPDDAKLPASNEEILADIQSKSSDPDIGEKLKKFSPPFGGRLVLKPEDLGKTFFFEVNALRDSTLVDLLVEKGIRFEGQPSSGFWPTLMVWVLPFVLIFGFWFLLMRQSGQMGRAALSFGRSRAKLQGDIQDVTFDDVAGCDEAKEELKEVVDFLKSPKKYQSLGGRMPKGLLLVGPPGTGKTLLARAVAGESKTPFFTLSGSDFVEMFVGVGAARVRDLFQQAKNKAPCIVFVDELDAVGRHRGAGLGGGHDEREQTLNQLLVEMDGFDTTHGVIFLAATNRPDVLDPALLRPGRFDRQIVIDAPDAKGRKAVLEVHARGKPFSPDVDFATIAAATPGFTGADLANALNEAALLAARRGKQMIEQQDVDEAVERTIAGPERKSRRLGEEERKRVAYHEAGHALVAALTVHSDPVRKISIVPRGHAALGYTMQTPDDDRYLTIKNALVDRLKTLLAGRAAEILVFEELSTGAASDLDRATHIARAMVCRYGMSDRMGPVTFGRDHQQVFLGRDFFQEERNYSDRSAEEIDSEVKRILQENSEAATKILERHRVCLDRIASTLLEREVIQGKELQDMLRSELGEDYRNRPEEAETPGCRPASG